MCEDSRYLSDPVVDELSEFVAVWMPDYVHLCHSPVIFKIFVGLLDLLLQKDDVVFPRLVDYGAVLVGKIEEAFAEMYHFMECPGEALVQHGLFKGVQVFFRADFCVQVYELVEGSGCMFDAFARWEEGLG